MNKYIEAISLLEEYIQDYQKLIQENKINKYNSPMFLQYRSEIQDIIDFFQENREIIPFSIYQDFEKIIPILKELDEKLSIIIPEIKRIINLSHYQKKYPKSHWWWYL